MPTGFGKIILAMALFMTYTPAPASALLQSAVRYMPGPLQFGLTWVEQEGVNQ